MQIQLAWKIIELLETLADFILEYYIEDDSSDTDIIEDLTPDKLWTD